MAVIVVAFDAEAGSGGMGTWIETNWFLWIFALLLDVVIPLVLICNRKNSLNTGVSISALVLFTLSIAYTFCWLMSFTIDAHPGAC